MVNANERNGGATVTTQRKTTNPTAVASSAARSESAGADVSAECISHRINVVACRAMSSA
jgi:hypothetical protein